MYYYQNYIINIVHTMHALYTKSCQKQKDKEHFKEQIYWNNDSLKNQISPNSIYEQFRLVLCINLIQNSPTKRTHLILLYTNLKYLGVFFVFCFFDC